MTAQWLAAPDAAGQEKAAKALSHVAMTDVARCRLDNGTARPRSAGASPVCCKASRRIPGTSGRRSWACAHRTRRCRAPSGVPRSRRACSARMSSNMRQTATAMFALPVSVFIRIHRRFSG